jgi:hypothetical protein
MIKIISYKSRFSFLSTGFIAFTFVFMSVSGLMAGIDVTSSFPSTATVLGQSVMSVEVRRVDTDVAVSSISWGTVPSSCTYVFPQSYIVLSATCNLHTWKIDIYTDNVPRVSTDSANGVYQVAGMYNKDSLSGTTDFVRLPLLWVCSDSKIPALASGGTSVANTVYGTTTTAQAYWAYMKDKGDIDDPGTGGSDESWSASQGSYTVCLYGGPGYMNIPSGISVSNPVVIYIECDFSQGAGGREYEGEIWFDLYH